MRTRFLKLAALMLALMLALTGCSLIEIDQEMDMAEAVATVNGVKITKGDVIDQYSYIVDYYAYAYSSYGIELTDSMIEEIKNDVLDMYIEQELLAQKAKELNLTDFSEESFAQADADAAAYFEELIPEHADHVQTAGMTEEESRAAIIAHMEADGITMDSLIDTYRKNYITELVYNHIVADAAVTDAELQAAYDEMVAADEEQYSANPDMYEMYQTSGEVIAWNPEGYRTVKHILFLTTDEQTAELSALTAQIVEVEAAISALDSETAAEGAKTADELNAEKASLEQALADKKAEIVASFAEKTQSVYDRLENGESFDALMAELGEDPGMKSEPAMSKGYYVAADSTMWDIAFRDTAMALENVGDVSEPVLSASGVHIIYYNADVPAGAVALEDLADVLNAQLLETKKGDIYAAQYTEWLNAASVKKYPKVLP